MAGPGSPIAPRASRGVLGARVLGEEGAAPLGEAPREHRLARRADERLVEVHVVDRGEDRREDLVRGEEVVQVGAREARRAGGAAAGGIDRIGVAAGGGGAEGGGGGGGDSGGRA